MNIMLKHHINICTKKTKNCSKIMRFIFLGHLGPYHIPGTCIVLLVLKYVSNLAPMSRSSFTLIFWLKNQIIQISEQSEKTVCFCLENIHGLQSIQNLQIVPGIQNVLLLLMRSTAYFCL